jgi:hypothetical protein
MVVAPHFRRTGVAVAASLAVLAALSGCGQDSSPAAAPSSPAAGTTTAAATTAAAATAAATTAAPTSAAPSSAAPTTPRATGSTVAAGSSRCHTSELSVAFGPVDAGAGQRHGTVILQDRSTRRCTLFGFGGLQVLDAAKRPLPVTLSRVGGKPVLIRFGPRSNQIAKTISWGAIPAGVSCVTPVYVLVTPPDETDPLTARWPYGQVCGGRIAGSAYGVNP